MEEKKNLWTQKKKKIILLIAAVMVLVFAFQTVATNDRTRRVCKLYILRSKRRIYRAM